jgi:hypothetical protein
MKKIVFLLACLTSSLAFSQMTMKKLDGTSINNGDIFTYSVIGNASEVTSADPAYLGFKIYNSSASNINVRMKVISMTNATGSNLQFCIDPICVGTITVGSSYPSGSQPYSVVPANGQNGNFDHFVNGYAGNGTDPVVYVLKFYMVNSFGLEIGTPITITYKYDPLLSTQANDLKSNGITLKSTLVDSQLEFEATAGGQTALYDVNGRVVSDTSYTSGYNVISVANLNAGVYILSFTTDERKKASLRIIKK